MFRNIVRCDLNNFVNLKTISHQLPTLWLIDTARKPDKEQDQEQKNGWNPMVSSPLPVYLCNVNSSS